MTAYLSEPRRRTIGRARGRSAPVGDLYDFSSLTLAGVCACSSQSSYSPTRLGELDHDSNLPDILGHPVLRCEAPGAQNSLNV
jgi:hypothetical protein